MKYKNHSNVDVMISYPPVEGQTAKHDVVKAGETKELDISVSHAKAYGLIPVGKDEAPKADDAPKEVKAVESNIGDKKVETKKKSTKKTTKK